MHQLIFASSKYAFFLLFFLSLPIIIEAPKILSVWLTEVPDHTVNFVRLILALITVDSLGSSISIAQQATGKIKKYQIWVGGIMLMIVPVAYIFLKLGSNPESVYIVYFSACIIAHITRMIIIKPMIRLSLREYFKKVVIKLIGVTVCSSIFPVLAYKILPTTIFSLIFICILCVIMVSLSVYFLGLEKNERVLVNGKVKNVYYKLSSKK